MPADYVAASWQPQIETPRGEGYGYLWFLPTWMGTPAACAVGFGGQLIAVLPEVDLVVAVSTRITPDAPHPRVWQKEMFGDLLLPALRR